MKLLFCGSDNYLIRDQDHFDSFSRMPALTGHDVKTSLRARTNATEVALLAKQHKVDAVITTQVTLLEATLRQMGDYIPPTSRKQLSVDDYAGSWLTLPYDIPLLVLNPLERLATVPYERFIVNRYLTKLTKPDAWWVQTEFKWKQVTELNQDECLAAIENADLCSVDIETPGDEDRFIKLIGYCAYDKSTNTSKCFVVHFDSEWAWRFVQRANRTKTAKILQNGQYDASYFLRWNAPMHNWLWDTMTIMHCWYSEFPKRLDFLASFALRKQRYWKDDGKTGNIEDEMRYNALDCWHTLNAFLSMMREMPEWAMTNYLIEFKMNFPSLNAAMEGMRVDIAQFDKVRAEKTAAAEATLTRLQYLISEPKFNPRSPIQMKNLFNLLGCGRLPDTAKASMLKARAASPLNDVLLGIAVDYKVAAKHISSFTHEKIWCGRWFYAIDPAGTDTGRSASKASAFWCGGNIQNIDRGDSVKSFLCADDGWLLAEADKAQAEARCVGYMAGDTKLIELVEGPHDYHAWNAQAFFGVPYEKIFDEATGNTLDKELRDLSKRTNHGANYNMGADVMLDTMGPKKVAMAKITLKLPLGMRLRAVCQYLLDAYEKTYPQVKGAFYDSIIHTVETTNRLVSPLGWTRYFFAKPSKRNKPALNAAVAHGPQNLSVSILNEEWYTIWRATVYGNSYPIPGAAVVPDLRGNVRIKAQVHDSILFQYRINFDPRIVLGMMHTPIPVRGADGITRTMLIRSDLKSGAVAWSKLK